MDEYDQKAIDDIETYGCHILHIMEDEEHPRFSYSIGIEKSTSKPDLIIYGLKNEIAQWMINEYNRRIRNGEEFEPSKLYSGFLDGFDVAFIEVAKKHYKDHFGWGLWYNKGDDFKMLQLVFPSTSGVWPWDKEAPKDFAWFQPLLN